jgi:hypothetical protein
MKVCVLGWCSGRCSGARTLCDTEKWDMGVSRVLIMHLPPKGEYGVRYVGARNVTLA